MRTVAYNPKEMTHVIFYIEGGLCYTGEYTCMRIQRETIPAGKYVYECRNNDDNRKCIPAYIEKGEVYQNFTGTFITNSPIVFPSANFLCITDLNVIFDPENKD